MYYKITIISRYLPHRIMAIKKLVHEKRLAQYLEHMTITKITKVIVMVMMLMIECRCVWGRLFEIFWC